MVPQPGVISTRAKNVDRFPIPGLRGDGSSRISIDECKLAPSLRGARQIAALFVDSCRFTVMPMGFVPLSLRMENSAELVPCCRFHCRVMNPLKKGERRLGARQRLIQLALGQRKCAELP